MQRPWHVFITLSVCLMIIHIEGALAHDRSDRKNETGNNSVRLAQVSVAEEPAGQVEFNIPAQPLSSAVTAFADQANYRLLVTSDLTEGVRTSGVTGRHTPEEAISLLLAGTGLTYRLTEANTVNLERAPLPVQTPSGQNQGSPLPSRTPRVPSRW